MMWLIFFFTFGLVAFFHYRGKVKRAAITNNPKRPQQDPYTFEIVGEASYQSALRKIAGKKTEESKRFYTDATILHEPQNQYDSNAFKVVIDGQTVGYFSRDDALRFKDFLIKKGMGLNEPYHVDAVIVGGWKNDDGEGSYGVKLRLPNHLHF